MDFSKGYIKLIINPKSGASSSKRMLREFKEYLQSRGYDVRSVFTESLEHAGELAAQGSIDYDCSLVAASGGDGTIREVVHALEGSDKPLLVIPSGTENLLANELGFDNKTESLVRAFEGQELRYLDLGRAADKCFTSVAGFGFDAEVVRKVCAKRNGHIRHLDYFWPIWRTFWEYEFPPIEVQVDGRDVYNGRGLVFVGNISRYSLGLSILKDADYGDGKLDVCVLKCKSRLHLAKHSVMTIFKKHCSGSDAVYIQGRNVKVSSPDKNVLCELDGDPGPKLPVEINIIPKAVKVLVPPGAKPAGIRTRLIRMIG